ncbi:MAG: glycosyltransferase [Candidatus Bathyarchaeia archaeon]
MTKIVLRWGRHFIVQSSQEKHRLLSLLPSARIAVIPHPVYDMFADQRIPKEEARKYLKLPLDAPILLFFGMVREYKGLKTIIAAMPEIRARLEKVILLVVGEFWEDKRRYLEMIKRLGIEDSVIVEDRYIPNEEVGLYFSAADALIASYQQLTGSGAIQMARGFGIPVIFTNRCGKPRPLENQIFVEDICSLASQVIRFFTEGYKQDTTVKHDSFEFTSWEQLVDVIERLFDGGQI